MRFLFLIAAVILIARKMRESSAAGTQFSSGIPVRGEPTGISYDPFSGIRDLLFGTKDSRDTGVKLGNADQIAAALAHASSIARSHAMQGEGI